MGGGGEGHSRHRGTSKRRNSALRNSALRRNMGKIMEDGRFPREGIPSLMNEIGKLVADRNKSPEKEYFH
jgi:hypothetical protein